MDTADLKEYLGIVVDMEKSIFMQGNIIKQLENECSGLGRENKFPEPPFPSKRPQPEKPLPPSPPDKPNIKTFNLMKRNGVASIIIVSLLMGLSLPQAGEIGILSWLIAVAEIDAFCGMAVAIITYFLCRDKDRCEKEKYQLAMNSYGQALNNYQKASSSYQIACVQIEKEYRAAICSYQDNLQKYKDNVDRDLQRVATENVKKEILMEELSKAKRLHKASSDVLQQIYDKNIIFPKYRNLVMVCSLYEYICAGRCDTLEGHEGAYNILELEIRLDRVIVQLDRVISMLERISQNQYVIYTAIQDANQQSAKILESTHQMTERLQEIQIQNQHIIHGIQSNSLATEQQTAVLSQQITALQKTSALTAYQAERTQKELHYMNRMHYLSGKYDNVFFNLPPM